MQHEDLCSSLISGKYKKVHNRESEREERIERMWRVKGGRLRPKRGLLVEKNREGASQG